jgi:thioredoxin 1
MLRQLREAQRDGRVKIGSHGGWHFAGLCVTFPVKSGNILLLVVFVCLGGMLFMLRDVMSPSKSGAAMKHPQLRAALASGQPVLLEFYAEWCPPCRMVGPKVDELAGELQGKARVVRLNVDENSDLAREYGVQSIPAFIALKNGSETSRQVGAIEKPVMRSMLGL